MKLDVGGHSIVQRRLTLIRKGAWRRWLPDRSGLPRTCIPVCSIPCFSPSIQCKGFRLMRLSVNRYEYRSRTLGAIWKDGFSAYFKRDARPSGQYVQLSLTPWEHNRDSGICTGTSYCRPRLWDPGCENSVQSMGLKN